MSRHANISIFVPHMGCPHRCSFCDQNSITGQTHIPTAADVDAAVQTAMQTPGYSPQNTQIAFFGGSFTAIAPDYMCQLLDAAQRHILAGHVRSVRISTRPDAVNADILDLLKAKGVESIELGAQSMQDAVLQANGRGHTARDTVTAAALIRQKGFVLGLQMMTGLYGSTPEADKATAEQFVALRPDQVRIYPTLVLKNTHLAVLYAKGEYSPQSLEATVSLCSDLLWQFYTHNIPVIRLGLHTVAPEDFLAGPWHPAFRELCESRLYLERAKAQLTVPGTYLLHVQPAAFSKMTGQKRQNIEILAQLGYNCKVSGDPLLKMYEVSAEKM